MTVIELTNLALLKIGVSKGIEALDQAAQEAWTAELVYDHHLRQALRRHPWGFATKYADLLLARGPLWDTDAAEMVNVQAWDSSRTYAVGDVVRRSSVNYYCILASTNNQPPNSTYWSTDADDAPDYANGDWLYGYRVPSDCLFARRLVNDGSGRRFDATPIPFRIGRDVNGLLLFTNQVEANLEYTVIDCDHLYADDLFIDFFTWQLAAAMAPSLSKNGLTSEKCMALAELALRTAATVTEREQQQEPHGDASWINAR